MEKIKGEEEAFTCLNCIIDSLLACKNFHMGFRERATSLYLIDSLVSYSISWT